MPIRSVLLVDDSKSARFALRKILQGHGLEVSAAESGQEALHYLQANRPDAVFMDHMMPEMDGFQTMEVIKSNPETARIPVIMCTSNDSDEYRREAVSRGAMSSLPKPATPEALERVLGALNRVAEEAPSEAANVPEAAVSATSAGMTEQQIRSIVEETVSAALESAVQTLVGRLIEDRLVSFREEAADSARTEAARLLDQAMAERPRAEDREAEIHALEQQIQAVRETVQTAEKQTLSLAEDVARRIVTEAKEQQAEELGSRFAQQIEDAVAPIARRLDAPEPLNEETQHKIESLAASTAERKATETAAHMIQRSAESIKDTAQQLAEEKATSAVRRAMAETESPASSLESRMYLLSGLAAAAGVAAAVILHFLG